MDEVYLQFGELRRQVFTITEKNMFCEMRCLSMGIIPEPTSQVASSLLKLSPKDKETHSLKSKQCKVFVLPISTFFDCVASTSH